MQNTSHEYINSLPLVLPLPSQREQTIVDILIEIHVCKKKKKKKQKKPKVNNLLGIYTIKVNIIEFFITNKIIINRK